MFLAPFVVFCVNALFQWYLIGITPVEKLGKLCKMLDSSQWPLET